MKVTKLLKRILPESITSYFQDISVRLSNCEKAIETLLDEEAMDFDEVNAFNGQVKRREIFREIIDSVSPDCIMETGTWTGETTAFMARVSGRPVLSCETNQIAYLLAKKRHVQTKNVELFLQDSRVFLSSQIARRPPDRVLFIYLDAHWNVDLPLVCEIEIVAQKCKNSSALGFAWTHI